MASKMKRLVWSGLIALAIIGAGILMKKAEKCTPKEQVNLEQEIKYDNLSNIGDIFNPNYVPFMTSRQSGKNGKCTASYTDSKGVLRIWDYDCKTGKVDYLEGK